VQREHSPSKFSCLRMGITQPLKFNGLFLSKRYFGHVDQYNTSRA